MILLNRKTLLLLLISLQMTAYGSEIPRPKNNQLYTEYISYKYARYLKKPAVSEGIIAMDGKDKFILKQTKPVQFTVKKIGDRMTYKKQNMDEIIIEENSSDSNFMFLFDGSVSLDRDFNITEKQINDKTEYIIIPKAKSRFIKIIILAKENIFIKLELYFSDNSKIIYEFKNTVTGVKPDAEIFK